MPRKVSAKSVVKKKTKPSTLTATERRQVMTAIERLKAKAKKRGAPMKQPQINAEKAKMEATIKRRKK